MSIPFLLKYGNYPVEYNRAIHGPYDPSRYYGKRKLNIQSNID